MEIARGGEVLEALTRILRREATESALVTLREREPVECADGKVRYRERVETKVVELPPKLSDVSRAADLLGRLSGLWGAEAGDGGTRVLDDVRGGTE